MTSVRRQIEEKVQRGYSGYPEYLWFNLSATEGSNVAELRDVHVFAEFLRFKPQCVCLPS